MKTLISAAVLSFVLAGAAVAQEVKPAMPAAGAAAVVAPAAPASVIPAAPAVIKPAVAAPAATAVVPAAPTVAGKAVEAVKSAVMPAAAAPAVTTTAKVAAPAVAAKKLININTATAAELDALPQIGEARTKAIIAGRPYKSVDELATKAKLPANAVDAIKGLVGVK
jgi:competence protein ComEA